MASQTRTRARKPTAAQAAARKAGLEAERIQREGLPPGISVTTGGDVPPPVVLPAGLAEAAGIKPGEAGDPIVVSAVRRDTMVDLDADPAWKPAVRFNGVEYDVRTLAQEAETTPDDDVLLDLDAAPKRQKIKKTGRMWELRTLRECGLRTQHRLTTDGAEFADLWRTKTELTDEQSLRMAFLVERMFRDIMIATDDERSGFSEDEQAEVVFSFTLAPLVRQTAMALQAMEEAQAQQAAAGSISES